MAVEKILLQFEADIKDLKSELGEVKSQLGNVEKQTEQTGSKMTNTFKNVGKAIAGALSIQMLINFGRESVELARKADGVKRAFDRLNDPNLLAELRKATRGTVSDLELMQNAVKASNFQIPLNKMGTMLAFASKQARDMGENVDYMVESITVGVARKSIPILDNLGISSAQISEEMEKTGDFAQAVGNIMERSMKTTADTTLTASERIAQFRAEIENTKVALGEELLPVADASNKFILTLVRAFSSFTESSVASIEGIKIVSTAIDDLGDSAQVAGNRLFAYLLDPLFKFMEGTNTIESLQRELRVLQDLLITLPIGSEVFLDTQKEIKKVQEELDRALGRTGKLAKELKYDFDNLYPPVDTLTKAMTAFGEAFAIMRQSADGIDLGLDIERTAAAIGALPEGMELLKGTTAEYVDTSGALNENLQDSIFYAMRLSDAMGMLQGSIQDIAGEQEKFTNFLQSISIAQILFARSVAIAEAVKGAATGLDQPGGLLKFLATTTFIIAQITGFIGDSLKVARGTQIPAYAGGVVDLKGEGTETSDSILARLSKGESVITAKGTRQDKKLFEAANKLMLDEYIHANYVLPALKEKQNSDRAMFDDYRLYRTMINGQKQDKELNKQLIKVLGQRVNKHNNWA